MYLIMHFTTGTILIYAKKPPKKTTYLKNELNKLIVAVAEMFTGFSEILATVITYAVMIFVEVLAMPIGGNSVIFSINGYCDFFAVSDLCGCFICTVGGFKRYSNVVQDRKSVV